MAATKTQQMETEAAISPWHSFRSGLWQKEIDVRDFIQQNYEPYEGDESFLRPATKRTQRIWDRLNQLFARTKSSLASRRRRR